MNDPVRSPEEYIFFTWDTGPTRKNVLGENKGNGTCTWWIHPKTKECPYTIILSPVDQAETPFSALICVHDLASAAQLEGGGGEG